MALRLVSAAAAAAAVFVLVAVVVEKTEGWNEYCQISDVTGVWKLTEDLKTGDDFRFCWRTGSSTIEHRIRLSYPDLAQDEYGNYGHWTLIYGVAIEISIHGRKYFTFFPKSYQRYVGWRVDCRNLGTGSSTDILTHNYACFVGRKLYGANETGQPQEVDPNSDPTIPTLKDDHQDDDQADPTDHPPTFLNDDPPPTDVPTEKKKYKLDYDLVDRINNNGLGLWEAKAYDHLRDINEEDMVKMAGGNMTLRGRPPKPAPVTDAQLLKLKQYPKAFDWRNVDGVSYVSSVRNQGYCGSCYAFAALGAYESRIRIMTKNTLQPVLSPQDIVNCNPYTYGCHGGWIFTEGKYAEIFGFIDENCNSYSAEDERCQRDATCQRYYGTNYQYIGGFFGGSNEFLMMDAIFNNGPVVVGFAVYHDMFYYRRGIYYHAGPDWLMGYHAVIVVGWGQDQRSGTKYWIVKNSWGKSWGEDGYFRMIRGSNDCDIEAEAFEAFPII